MAWYVQLDNEGKKTDIKRFFTEAQERGLSEIQKKTKRVRWVVTNEEIIEANKNVIEPAKPTKSITLMDVNEANDIDTLNELSKKAESFKVKNAIKNKIESLTKNMEE